MSLAGHLSELALPDLLQIVAMAEKSGRLDLTTRDGEGLIVFRGGRILYAASNAARETLGNILVCRHLVTEDVLHKALERQYRSREERRLGSILVQMGAVTDETLESVIYEQIQRVIGELVKWRDGYFKFEAMEIPDHGEVEVDAREFVAETGFNAHRIALELSRIADEAVRDAALKRAPAASGPVATDQADAAASPSSSLATILAMHATPALTAETTMEVLRAGAGFFTRGVLLLVERYGLTGVGQFGVREGDTVVDEGIRSLWFPLDVRSALAEAVASGRTHRGPLERTELHEMLAGELGGDWPVDVALLPIRSSGRIMALLYGDSMPAGTPLPALDRLEARLAEIGAAMATPVPPPAKQGAG